MDKRSKSGTGFKLWLLIWGLGMAGQICWNIENQWFNTFVYAKIAKDPAIITWMLSISAAATTFSTFFFGTWSDRTGKRRLFIGIGYILWGVFTIAFGLTEFIDRKLFLLAAVCVVAADMIMSFFGSMGNDSGFNTWTNDVMTPANRGQIGAALATQPILGTILGTLVGGMLVGADDNYMRLFCVMGGFVIVFGVVSLLCLGKKDDVAPSVQGTFWQQFASVFNFREFVKLRELLFVNLGLAVFFTGFNIFFAHLGNYLIYYLGYSADQMGVIEAVPLVLAMLTAIPMSSLINRNKHPYLAVFSIVMSVAGLLILWPISKGGVDTSSIFDLRLWLGVFIVGVGYIAILQTTKVWTKQLYPADRRGQFEGIWILFFVLIPNVLGSSLGGAIVKTGGEQFMNAASGQMEYIPNGLIFLVGAGVIALSAIPFSQTFRPHAQRIRSEREAGAQLGGAAP